MQKASRKKWDERVHEKRCIREESVSTSPGYIVEEVQGRMTGRGRHPVVTNLQCWNKAVVPDPPATVVPARTLRISVA